MYQVARRYHMRHPILRSNSRLSFAFQEFIPCGTAQLPYCLGGAVETANDRAPSKHLGLEDGEPQHIEGFLALPAVLGVVDLDEETPIRELRMRIPHGLRETRNLAFHPATSWFGRA